MQYRIGHIDCSIIDYTVYVCFILLFQNASIMLFVGIHIFCTSCTDLQCHNCVNIDVLICVQIHVTEVLIVANKDALNP